MPYSPSIAAQTLLKNNILEFSLITSSNELFKKLEIETGSTVSLERFSKIRNKTTSLKIKRRLFILDQGHS